MSSRFTEWIRGLEPRPPASIGAIRSTELSFGVLLPGEYVEFMLMSNGAEGSIGTNAYLSIWPIEEVVPLTHDTSLHEIVPELIVFGSDGGGLAYAFDTREPHLPIVEVPFDSLNSRDATPRAETLAEFLRDLQENQ